MLPIVLKDHTRPNDNITAEPERTPIWGEILGMMVRSEERPGDRPEGEGEGEGEISFLSVDQDRGSNRDSSRSSVSTVTHAAIVRTASVAKRAVANIIERRPPRGRDPVEEEEEGACIEKLSKLSMGATNGHPESPQSSQFGSEESSGSSSFPSHDHATPLSEEPATPVLPYLDTSPLKPGFTPTSRHNLMVSATDTFGGVDPEDEGQMMQRPTIVISAIESTTKDISSPGANPLTPSPSPSPRYRGWLSQVVKPLERYIDESTDPREHYVGLQEIAEAESGSVYAARVIDAHKLKLPASSSDDNNGPSASSNDAQGTFVAIKNVPILPVGSAKLDDLQRELGLMEGIRHAFVLSMDALYVDLLEDSLWIRMELMERSLTDVVALVNEGLMVQERMMARFASDVR
jgi:p21-activated kinase 1